MAETPAGHPDCAPDEAAVQLRVDYLTAAHTAASGLTRAESARVAALELVRLAVRDMEAVLAAYERVTGGSG